MNKLYLRLLNICYQNSLHHLGSYFSCLEILDNIYGQMEEDDIFILSNGHAVVALYVILEDRFSLDAQDMLDEFGEHPKRNEDKKIHCSTGSLGMGVTVAVGRAMADRSRDVYCMLSDGECAEGSVWEALRFKHEHDLGNLKIYVNANGFAAYDAVDSDYLEKRIKAFCPSVTFIRTSTERFGLNGIDAHYHNFTEEEVIKIRSELTS